MYERGTPVSVPDFRASFQAPFPGLSFDLCQNHLDGLFPERIGGCKVVGGEDGGNCGDVSLKQRKTSIPA